MTWLKNLFSSKPNHYEDSAVKNTTIAIDDNLDDEFINALYFKNDQIKDNYISSIKQVLNSILETGEISRVRVSEYMTKNETGIPFLLDAIKTDNRIGKFKIESYYTALGICRHNLFEKIEAGNFDFQFEETLARNALKSYYRKYARLETLFTLGKAFFHKKDFEKMSYYFDIIRIDDYELSESTVSNFHRLIGDIYLECDKKIEGLNWYKSGLKLNANLGVKKITANLEKELNGS